MFRELVGDTAVLKEGGVYKVCPLYEYNGYLFAKVGGGYVKLYDTGSTSKSNGKLSIDTMQIDTTQMLYRDDHGRLMTSKVNDKVRTITPTARALLLEAPGGEGK